MKNIGSLTNDNEKYLFSLRKMAESNLSSRLSPLTGLYQTAAFFYKANELLYAASNQSYALIRIDLYRFKTVNEFLGRKEGDNLLLFIAECFKKYQNENTVVCHMRADIFILLTPYEEKEELIAIVEDIASRIEAYPIACKILPAFGICTTEFAYDCSTLSDYANLALQTIKGKVFVSYSFYDEKLRNQLMYEKKIENDIVAALKEHHLEVYIQPKVNMLTDKIIGGEALLRWKHPVDGFISPEDFIPILERSGYIIEVDLYVWEEVFKFLRNWINKGYDPIPISVNVSRLHAYQSNFKNSLCFLSKKYNISPRLICLELTETALLQNSNLLFENIKDLQQEGFIFSMDDFGLGYSSINMLKDEPIDEVKIDRNFLSDITKMKSRIVTSHIISMIYDLTIDMIAEGVESQEQADFLINCGCNKAQGFFYYRPMPIAEFEKLLLQKK